MNLLSFSIWSDLDNVLYALSMLLLPSYLYVQYNKVWSLKCALQSILWSMCFWLAPHVLLCRALLPFCAFFGFPPDKLSGCGEDVKPNSLMRKSPSLESVIKTPISFSSRTASFSYNRGNSKLRWDFPVFFSDKAFWGNSTSLALQFSLKLVK